MKTIVVHVAEDGDLAGRLAATTYLATRFGAHVVGLSTHPFDLHIPAAVRGRGASLSFVREMRQMADEHERASQRIFDAEIARAGISAEWRRDDREPMEALALHSRCADLLMVSQTPPENLEDYLTGEQPDHVCLTAASPTLVVPHGKTPASIGDRVLIAWRANREAARAVRDALPVLRKIGRATVLTVGPTEQDHPPGADIAAYLSRHDIKVETRTNDADGEPGEIILAIAREIDADLVVMGAYGRSRLRELILGGTTEYMISHATMPIWLSH